MRSRTRPPMFGQILALLLALCLVAVACGGDDDGGTGDDGGDVAVGDGGGGGDDDGAPTTTAAPVEDVIEGNVCIGDACDEASTGDDEVPQPVPGGTLRIAVEAETDGLNPTANNFAVSAYTMGFTIFDPLFYIDRDGNWFPFLAESATSIGDGSSWQVKVREGITFHDGTPLNADALIANFEAAITDPIISLAIVPNYTSENRVEKIDDLTVQYNLIRPSAHFPVNLTSQLGMMASPAWLAAAAENDSLNQAPVGTGPFMLESRNQDVSTKVVKNPDYWRGTDDIYLDAIEFFITTDTALAAEQMGAGDLDVVVTSNSDATLTLRDADGVSTFENLYSAENFVMMNTRAAPTDDIRVRQALTFATDRQAYHDLIGQGTMPLADSMYHPDLIWNNADVVQEGNMGDRAGPLVDAYCADFPGNCSNGKVKIELQFSGPSTLQDRIMDVLSAGWEPYFEVERQQLPQDQHILQTAIGQFQVVTWRQFGSIEPDNEVVWLECATATGGITLNWVRLCSEDRDALLFEQRATTDLDRRVEIMQEIQSEIQSTYTYIFLTHTNWTVGFRNAVKNICGQTGPDDIVLVCNNEGRGFYHNVWIDEG